MWRKSKVLLYGDRQFDIFKDIAEDVETRFDTSHYELDCQKEKIKNVIGLMNDELGRKIMTKIVGLRAKACSYLKMTVVRIKKQKAKKVFHIKKTKLNLTF